MFEVRTDRSKHCIYVTLGGVMTAQEMRTGTDKIIAEAQAFRSGWRIVTDVTTLKPSSPEVANEIELGQIRFVAAGCFFGVRITGDATISAMKLKRTAKEAGYNSINVHTMDEAEIELARHQQVH